jgi:hypothetical protein
MGASASSSASSLPQSPFKTRLDSSPEKQQGAFTDKSNPTCEKLMEFYSNPKITGYRISINTEEWYSLIDDAYDALFETTVIRIRDKIANIDALLETNQVNSVEEMTTIKKNLEEEIMNIKKEYDDEKEKSKNFVSETIKYFIANCNEDALRILYNLGYFLKDGGMIPFQTMKEYKTFNGKVLLKGVYAGINHHYAAELAPKLKIDWSGGSKKRRHKTKYLHSRPRRSSKHYSHSRRRSSKHRFNK